jgi:hypothetical protein
MGYYVRKHPLTRHNDLPLADQDVTVAFCGMMMRWERVRLSLAGVAAPPGLFHFLCPSAKPNQVSD